MKPIAFVLVAVLGCGKSDSQDHNAVPAAGQPAAAPSAAPAAPPPVADLDPCSLLTADEVGKEFGKTVIAKKEGRHECEYGLDPAEQEKAMLELEKGGAAGIVKNGNFKMPSAISNQLVVDLATERDTQTEDEIKTIYSRIGSAVNGALKPDEHGLNNTIEAGKDIPNVGDWAFTTNVTAVSMGAGMSTRGRLLEARKGALRLTLSVTIAPDPGADKLDTQMGDLARLAVAKMK
ncbi:MAG TPA: hypothetical protein VFQ65_11735 [Kofleriaceae bacterium]|nr:hypothetical protein [Kofleriaceae bacterium]